VIVVRFRRKNLNKAEKARIILIRKTLAILLRSIRIKGRKIA